jgi:hypothetical protein
MAAGALARLFNPLIIHVYRRMAWMLLSSGSSAQILWP